MFTGRLHVGSLCYFRTILTMKRIWLNIDTEKNGFPLNLFIKIGGSSCISLFSDCKLLSM